MQKKRQHRAGVISKMRISPLVQLYSAVNTYIGPLLQFGCGTKFAPGKQATRKYLFIAENINHIQIRQHSKCIDRITVTAAPITNCTVNTHFQETLSTLLIFNPLLLSTRKGENTEGLSLVKIYSRKFCLHTRNLFSIINI